jgi:predicted GNAT family acetyltransferase
MHPLDNPIWQALTTTHARLAKTFNSASRFVADVSVLCAFSEPTPENYHSLGSLLDPEERVGVFLPGPPVAPADWTVVSTGPLFQMVYKNGARRIPEVPTIKQEFLALTQADVPEMMALTKLTKPGPFNARTHEMGDYVGIRSGGTLAAMAGERLRMPGYTEISAVCTHPDHLGHGYATALMKVLIERICSRGELPLLHVRPENTRAVKLYEHLGFETRVKLQYAVLCKGPTKSSEP